jgi:hypothetical protein
MERHIAVTYCPLEKNMIKKDLLCSATLMNKENLLIPHIDNPLNDDNCTRLMSFGEVGSGLWQNCERRKNNNVMATEGHVVAIDLVHRWNQSGQSIREVETGANFLQLLLQILPSLCCL